MSGKLRHNGRELAFLAQQKAGLCDKEGILQIKEKQEGLFKKGEAFVERWFKLRGNLLFYFKTRDPKSEPVGVVVLERFAVELDLEEELPYSFVLIFEGDDKVQKLAAASEPERDGWIESLHIASYECMKMQLESLREQLKSKTGRDPIDNPEPSELQENNLEEIPEDTVPFLEMCLACDSLPGDRDQNGRPPNSFAAVHILTPPQQQWVTHAHTEIVERDSNPVFLTTIGFTNKNLTKLSTRVKIVLYDVKERMTNTMTQIGSAMFTVTDLLTAPACRLRLRLHGWMGDRQKKFRLSEFFVGSSHSNRGSANLVDVGNLTVAAWQNEDHFVLQNEEPSRTSDAVGMDLSLAPPLPIKSKAKRIEMLTPMYDNIITKTFRFPTNSDTQLSVHEYMGESKLTFLIPKQLLKLWVEEEEQMIHQLQDLGQLAPAWDEARGHVLDFHMSSVSTYTQHAKYLSSYQGPPFKPSSRKGQKELEFVPVNLHLQRMWVCNEAKKTSSCYDIMTVGAFTAYPQKYRHGGLRRMLQEVKEKLTHNAGGNNSLERINEILNSITMLRTAVGIFCDEVCRAANQGDSADLNNSVQALSDKVRQLIQVCESPVIEKAIQQFARVKRDMESPVRPRSDSPIHTAHHSPKNNRLSEKSSPEGNWKWTGRNFVKSPTEEPWDLTRANMEAALLCVVSIVDDIMRRKDGTTDVTSWLSQISPLIIKLMSCMQVTCDKAKASLTFSTVELSSQHINLLHTIKYRRDVVFSQALTTATGAFITKLRSSLTNDTFLRQICRVGILMEFESLVSCHGDEMGMLEDFSVAVDDLCHVTFKITQAKNMDDVLPVIQRSSLLKSGGNFPDYNRCGYSVCVPVTEHMYQLLPKELQRGHAVKVTPLLFNMGINEQATLAETFGDLTVQEQINLDSYKRLSQYWEKYSELIGEPECHERNPLPMEQMLRTLHMAVVSKKSKNTEMLHQASEICRKLNAVRFTSCKSAKDRTAMGVTLEQVQLLQREHDLASHIFMHALGCMRSEGVRRDNTLKNTGSRKYAFNSLQLLSIPKLYRPPHGTFGNVQT